LLPSLKDVLQSSTHADFCIGYFNLRDWKSLVSSSDTENYDQLKKQTLELWCQQQLNLGNNRPVGRPSWFLLSASEQYFKRAWAHTFDFLPLHWQNQHQSVSRRAFNRNKPRASHF